MKDSNGQIHSMTLTKPVPEGSESTDIRVRLAGSAQTEDRKRAQFQKYAQSLKTLLSGKGAMYTSTAVTELYKVEPNFKKDLGNLKFWDLLKLFPETFAIQTSAAGGTSRVRLRS